MELVSNQFAKHFQQYIASPYQDPLYCLGDALHVLCELPDESIDFVMTSPPYWAKREYLGGGIGLEDTAEAYIVNLLAIIKQIHRLLKPTGSFWLNIGDTYRNKHLLGIPWRLALTMMDEQGWVLRNSVIWNKVKGAPDNSTDKLRNLHEHLFHFTKKAQGYYYDVDAIRSNPRQSRIVNGTIISATGVSGVRYKRQIELSTALTDEQQRKAATALDEMLEKMRNGEIADFRMIIRDQQRTTHSSSVKVSGRARELAEKGFYFLAYHPEGSKPGDVWEIIPEDTQKRKFHFAPYPEDLCKIPILSTCPEEGIALDPFCGTGTTTYVARILGRKSVGIDLSEEYLYYALQRSNLLVGIR
jgi:DNA modification methylase